MPSASWTIYEKKHVAHELVEPEGSEEDCAHYCLALKLYRRFFIARSVCGSHAKMIMHSGQVLTICAFELATNAGTGLERPNT